MIGNIIKQLRKQNGITQKQLGEYLGYTEAHISNIENGNRKLSSEDIMKISYFFKKNILAESQTSNFNFRSNNREDLNKIIVEDFKRYAKIELYGRQKDA